MSQESTDCWRSEVISRVPGCSPPMSTEPFPGSWKKTPSCGGRPLNGPFCRCWSSKCPKACATNSTGSVTASPWTGPLKRWFADVSARLATVKARGSRTTLSKPTSNSTTSGWPTLWKLGTGTTWWRTLRRVARPHVLRRKHVLDGDQRVESGLCAPRAMVGPQRVWSRGLPNHEPPPRSLGATLWPREDFRPSSPTSSMRVQP